MGEKVFEVRPGRGEYGGWEVWGTDIDGVFKWRAWFTTDKKERAEEYMEELRLG